MVVLAVLAVMAVDALLAVMVVVPVVTAVTVVVPVKLLLPPSNLDTMSNSVMFHPLALLPQPPSKLAPTLFQSLFSSDLPLPP